MTNNRESAATPSQSDKFKDAARELDADEDEKRWEERLKKVAKQKPQSESGAKAGDATGHSSRD